MKSSLLYTAVMALVATAIFVVSSPAVHAQQHRGGNSKSDTYLVVEFVDPSNVILKNNNNSGPNGTQNAVNYEELYKVITSSQLKSEKETIEKTYKTSVEEWEDVKETDPQTPKPIKPTIKTLKTFRTQKVPTRIARS